MGVLHVALYKSSWCACLQKAFQCCNECWILDGLLNFSCGSQMEEMKKSGIMLLVYVEKVFLHRQLQQRLRGIFRRLSQHCNWHGG